MSTRMNIMIVDDEAVVRESLVFWFQKGGHRVKAAASGSQALERLRRRPFDIMFVDIKMPGMNGIALLEKVKTDYPDTSVVIITAYGSIESAVKAMKIGAADYLLKPFKPDQLTLVMEKIVQQKKRFQEYDYLKDRLEKITRFDNIIGRSDEMLSVFDMIVDVADSDATVLLTGETGTGKELVAKAIHAKSARSRFPFIAVNCGAVPETLMESELFGHQKGAFSGATHTRKGFLEVVSGGTLFLDEIGEISAKMQVDLLRVLEDGQMTRIGSSQPVEVDFRLISATRQHLEQRIANGMFRRDFFYRINVITIDIPPLRRRKTDIPLLVEHFLKKFSQETTKQVDRISREALSQLTAYHWPGNVRELKNAIERAVVLSKSRTLDVEDFTFLQTPIAKDAADRSLMAVERRHLQRILKESNWNVTRAAAVLGINRVTLHKKIKRYNLKREHHR